MSLPKDTETKSYNEKDESSGNFDAIAAVRRFNAKLSAANTVFEQQTSCLRQLLSDSKNEIRNVVAEPSQKKQEQKQPGKEFLVTTQNLNQKKRQPRPPQSIDEALALLVP